MKINKILAVSALAISLSACNATTGNKGTIGTLLGAGGGALLGSQIGGGKGKLAAVAVGAVAGAFLGKSVGDSLDDLDRIKMQQTSQVALERIPDGQVSGWQNPNSGNSGTITPTRTFQEAGTYCREYQQTVVINGQQQTAYGCACRQPDGSWKIKS
jgi:surface antigen